jgi:hypothetical protein
MEMSVELKTEVCSGAQYLLKPASWDEHEDWERSVAGGCNRGEDIQVQAVFAHNFRTCPWWEDTALRAACGKEGSKDVV